MLPEVADTMQFIIILQSTTTKKTLKERSIKISSLNQSLLDAPDL